MQTQHSQVFNELVGYTQNLLLDDEVLIGAAKLYARKTAGILEEEEMPEEEDPRYSMYYMALSQWYLTLLGCVSSMQVCINVP